jgi:biotin transport system substrate-specific component
MQPHVPGARKATRSLPLVHDGQPIRVKAGFVALGAAMLAIASWIEVPMVPVPMTMQTYAVLVIGMALGWQVGAATILAYLGLAAVGVPVLAGGGAGLARLVGPTAGYLAGFLAAAVLVGWLAQRGWAGIGRCLVAMALGHAVVLGLGVLWLAYRIGWSDAVDAGLIPFLPGAVVKSVLGAATIELLRRLPSRAATRES